MDFNWIQTLFLQFWFFFCSLCQCSSSIELTRLSIDDANERVKKKMWIQYNYQPPDLNDNNQILTIKSKSIACFQLKIESKYYAGSWYTLMMPEFSRKMDYKTQYSRKKETERTFLIEVKNLSERIMFEIRKKNCYNSQIISVFGSLNWRAKRNECQSKFKSEQIFFGAFCIREREEKATKRRGYAKQCKKCELDFNDSTAFLTVLFPSESWISSRNMRRSANQSFEMILV